MKKGLSRGWSPENISCRMKVELPDSAISHTTVYRLVEQDKVDGGSLYRKLPRFGKTRWKGWPIPLIPDRKDITERSAIIEQRTRLGDWKWDTVHGQNAHLITFVDRKSRLTLIDKVTSKNAGAVAEKMIELLKRMPGAKSITLDNGASLPSIDDYQRLWTQKSTLPSPMPVTEGNQRKHQRDHPTPVIQKDDAGTSLRRGYQHHGIF